MSDLPIRFDTAGFIGAILELLPAVAQGELTPELAADAIDDLIDTGPWDSLDDVLLHALVGAIVVLIPDGRLDLVELLSRDPANMRARAARVEAHNPERAARIRARADRVEARRA